LAVVGTKNWFDEPLTTTSNWPTAICTRISSVTSPGLIPEFVSTTMVTSTF